MDSNKVGARITNFVFTIFPSSEADLAFLKNWFEGTQGFPKWSIVSEEQCGTTGRVHLQGAMCLGKQTAFKTVKNWIPFRSAHIEPMRGAPADSRLYCTKELVTKPDTWFVEKGQCPLSKTSGMDYAVHKIIEDKWTLSDLANDGELGFRAVAIHGRGLEKAIFYKQQATNTRSQKVKPMVFWLYGPTGTGKSNIAWTLGARWYGEREIYSCPDREKLQWHDGYYGQKVIVYEDFRVNKVKFNHLLCLTDWYPIITPVKGTFTAYLPHVIFFTTPKSIKDTFSWRNDNIPEDLEQLIRRVHGQYDIGNKHVKKYLFSLSKPVVNGDNTQTVSSVVSSYKQGTVDEQVTIAAQQGFQSLSSYNSINDYITATNPSFRVRTSLTDILAARRAIGLAKESVEEKKKHSFGKIRGRGSGQGISIRGSRGRGAMRVSRPIPTNNGVSRGDSYDRRHEQNTRDTWSLHP